MGAEMIVSMGIVLLAIGVVQYILTVEVFSDDTYRLK